MQAVVKMYIPGKPEKKGSYVPMVSKCKTFAYAFESNAAEQKRWAKSVATVAKQAMIVLGYKPAPKGTPVIASIMNFYFERPKIHYGTGRNSSVLKADAPEYKTSSPDKDKLDRCLNDALKGIVWHDDDQFVGVKGESVKRYCTTEGVTSNPGCLLELRWDLE